MGRPSSTPLARELQESLQQIRQMGGPFVVKIQRRVPFGQPEEVDQWEGITQDALGDDLAGRLWDAAGGGTYVLTIYTPDNKIAPKHQFTLVVPGEPRTPSRYATPPGAPFMASFPTSPSPWTSLPGMGMGGPSPWYPSAYGGFLPSLAAAGIPVTSSSGGGWEDQARADTARLHTIEEQRQRRMDDDEAFARRRQDAREEASRAAQESRMNDPLYLKMLGIGPGAAPAAPAGSSPELIQMQATVKALEASLAAERETRARDEAARQAQDAERRMREEFARQQAEAETRRRESEDRHRQEMERLRAEGIERDRRAEDARRQETEERRRAEEERKREMEALKALIEAKGKGPDHGDELRRLEEKFFNTTDRQREAEERRRIDDEARRRDEQLRNELAEQRRAAEAKHTEMILAATKPKDDAAMLTALSGIFGTTLKGSQDSSNNVLTAMTAMMDSSRKAGELPDWMGQILAKATSRGDEMAQVAQASGQIMSVALGAVGQVLQQMAGNHESPWLQIADSAFREIGSIGTALIQRGAGGVPIQMPAPDAGAIPTTAVTVALPAPRDTTLVDAPAQPGATVVSEKRVPLDKAPVDASEPVSPSQILATRVEQLRHSIRKNKLPAQAAAQAFVETVEFEAAYTGKLPHPLDEIGDNPRGVVDKLFGQWLRQFKGGDQYAEIMASWVEKFVREGLPEDEEEEEEGEEAAGEGAEPEAAHPAAPQVAPVATPTNGDTVAVHATGGAIPVPPAPPQARGRRGRPTPQALDAASPANGTTSTDAAKPVEPPVEPELVEAVPEE